MPVMKKYILYFFLFPCTGFAGNDIFSSSASDAAMANASVAKTGLWAALHNQAGLASLKNIAAGVSHESRFLVKELGISGFALSLPTKQSGVFAVSASYYGYTLYNEQKAGLAYAKNFGEKFAAGIQFDYLGISIGEDYGSKNNFTVEAGFIYSFSNRFRIGGHVFNPARAKLADYDDERVPTVINAGVAYLPSEKVLITAEAEKDIDEMEIIKAGLEYHIHKILFLRAGIATDPLLSSFGLGLVLKNVNIDFASTYHQVLGFSPVVSLSYFFDK